MNFVPGEIADGSFAGFGLRVPVPARLARRGRDARPQGGAGDPAGEHSRGHRGAPAATHRTADAEVELVEPLGHEVIVYGRLGENRYAATLAAHRLPERGSRLDMIVDLSGMHLFDTTSEQRLAQ
jgi:ABC-type sugar transport system ATPase subunit